MKLVNEQPYTTSPPFYPRTTTEATTHPVTSSYGGRGSLTFLERPASPVKTFSAYQGQLQPVKPKVVTDKPEFYYKPVVEPVYQPKPAVVTIKYNPIPSPPPQFYSPLPPSSQQPSHQPPPQPSHQHPPPPAPSNQQSYLTHHIKVYKNSQVEYTTPHPLIYGFKPVVSTRRYKTPVLQRHQVKHLSGHVPGSFRITYQQTRPITYHHNSKPIRFPPGRRY